MTTPLPKWLWCSADDPNTIFFIFEMRNRNKAEAFVTGPDIPRIAKAAGVLDGEIHDVEEMEKY